MFKQRWYGEALMFWKGLCFATRFDYNFKLVDYFELERYTNKDISVQEYTRFLTHMFFNNSTV